MMPHSMYGPHVLPSPVHSPAGVLGTLAGTSWEPPERRRQDHSGTPDALRTSGLETDIGEAVY